MSVFTIVSHRDHPRVCGEQLLNPSGAVFSPGSSPRVRGAAAIIDSAMSWFGIIPACAGSSLTNSASRFSARDHPRVCGEQKICNLSAETV